MCKPVDQGIGQDLVLDDLSPAVEGQVCGDDGGLCIGSEREMIEEQLSDIYRMLGINPHPFGKIKSVVHP